MGREGVARGREKTRRLGANITFVDKSGFLLLPPVRRTWGPKGGKGEFVSSHPRLHLEYLPAYDPELNPDEGAWFRLEGSLTNGRPDDILVSAHQKPSSAPVSMSRRPPLVNINVAYYMQSAINEAIGTLVTRDGGSEFALIKLLKNADYIVGKTGNATNLSR